MDIRDLLKVMFAAPIAGVHSLIMGLKAIIGGVSVLWSLAKGETDEAQSKWDKLEESIGRNVDAINRMDVMGALEGKGRAKPTPGGFGGPASSYDAEILAASKRHGIDPALIKAVMKTESRFNPNLTSPKGAMGLMQLMPGTAGDMGVDNAYDPSQAIEGGTKYLAFLSKMFGGDLVKTIAAYNAGPRRVQRADGIPNIPETQSYVKQVMAARELYSSGEKTAVSTAGVGGGVNISNTYTGGINIEVKDSQNPSATAKEVLRQLREETQQTRSAYQNMLKMGGSTIP